MQVRTRLGIAAATGLMLAVGSGWPARAQQQQQQDGSASAPYGNFIPFLGGIPPQVRMPPQGSWFEVLHATSKWIVVQNQQGQQFPIASDRVRQFLIRWPSSAGQLTPQSVVEVSGPDAGSNVIIADHLDVFEADAQSLVSPSVNNYLGNVQMLPYGNFQTISSYASAEQDPFNIASFMTAGESAMQSRLHIVGNTISNDPIRVAGPGQNWYTIQPSANGMSMTQVTIGNNTYARRGDLVYLVPENVGPRSLDVQQLVLYKKMPLRAFQP